MDRESLEYYTAWHAAANDRQYDAPPDPWRPVRVDPRTVTTYNDELGLNWGIGRVRGGGWDADEHCHPLGETSTYRTLVQRFEEGRPWEETPLYERAQDVYDRGDRLRGYESLEAFRAERCAYLDELFERIDREGFRPNAAAGHDNPAAGDNPWEDAAVHHLEPLVVVDRDGGIHLTEGFHRVVIAGILGIDAVPVQVLCRHEAWQRTRESVAAAGLDERPPELDDPGDHPDLVDVVAGGSPGASDGQR